MTVALIDYGSGNLHSAAKALERVGAAIDVTSDPDRVRRADRIVLPGVGAFRDCAEGLKALPGMWETLEEEVARKAKPFLGICVGMQLMATRGLEHAETGGFGWIAGDVAPLAPSDPALKIPHMGWNTASARQAHPLLKGIALGDGGLHAYFVHSYHLAAGADDIALSTDYGGPFASMVAKGNMAGTQFHPEKSQTLGLKLLENFLAWRP
jgi:imidazole glycerol-phosphate synthase subunit HisH